MTSRDFCYWLQGYIEVSRADGDGIDILSEAQVKCIQAHLSLVFKHEIDPSAGDEKHQAELNNLHHWQAPDAYESGVSTSVRC